MRTISKDTQAILLLCGQWNKHEKTEKPLTLSEYNLLTEWLKMKSLKPSDLMESDSFREDASFSLDVSRIKALLCRGGSLAMDLERWLNMGGWVLSRADKEYPKRLKEILGKYAPPFFYGIGQQDLLLKEGIAFVGSRDVSIDGQEAVAMLSSKCANGHICVISGGARGVDQIAMSSALSAGGVVIGIIANDLLRLSVSQDCRDAIETGRLVLLSPFHPTAGFHVGNAMARNKVIYALANAAVVISASDGTGGTWEGAVENLQKWHIPLFVRPDQSLSGNLNLIKKGAYVLPQDAYQHPEMLQRQEYAVKLCPVMDNSKKSKRRQKSSSEKVMTQKLLPFI